MVYITIKLINESDFIYRLLYNKHAVGFYTKLRSEVEQGGKEETSRRTTPIKNVLLCTLRS